MSRQAPTYFPLYVLDVTTPHTSFNLNISMLSFDPRRFYKLFTFSCQVWSDVKEATGEGGRRSDFPSKPEQNSSQRGTHQPRSLDRSRLHHPDEARNGEPLFRLPLLPPVPVHTPQPRGLDDQRVEPDSDQHGGNSLRGVRGLDHSRQPAHL